MSRFVTGAGLLTGEELSETVALFNNISSFSTSILSKEEKQYRITLKSGLVVVVGENQQILTKTGGWVAAKDFSSGMIAQQTKRGLFGPVNDIPSAQIAAADGVVPEAIWTWDYPTINSYYWLFNGNINDIPKVIVANLGGFSSYSTVVSVEELDVGTIYYAADTYICDGILIKDV